ncbi:MAG TPA: RelA/SpoT domain-containing protein [Gaiellaceae bacterium]
MTGEEFPYSISQVRKAGDRIRRAAERGERPSDDDLYLLDVYRASHTPIHRIVQSRLGVAVARETINSAEIAIAGRPLKTHEAIIAKLVREKSRLNRIQDIAGARVVVTDIAAQELVLQATLDEFKAQGAAITKDTRAAPDALGYRGLHVVIEIDGRYAEIQIRTRLQGLWAQVVEKADERIGSDLKHGVGDPETLNWLRAFSDRLQRVEQGEKIDWATTLEAFLALWIVKD